MATVCSTSSPTTRWHNPQAVKHFCDVASQSSHLVGDVVITPVKDIVRDEHGKDAGVCSRKRVGERLKSKSRGPNGSLR